MSDTSEEPARRGCSLPEYDDATMHLLMECVDGLAAAQDPLLGMISRDSTDALPSADVPPGVTQGAYKSLELEMRFALSTRAALSTDVDEWAASVQDSVDKALPSLMSQIFGQMGEILREAGQDIDAQGQPLSMGLLLKALEKIEIDFDADGKPKMPTLVVHPEMAKKLAETPPTPEEEKQLEALIERKRQEFYARRRVRKLD